MLQKLQNHLAEHFPFLLGKKLLLAISGGLDSMVMLDLFKRLNYSIAIAHCNFQLRGLESFDDQSFVYQYAKVNDLPVFITQFDTQAFANDYKLSTQVAARELRYNWFYELLEDHNYDYILTGHHADDNLETFLINLSRGTGLDGLTGIPFHNDKIIRPLLPFSQQEIAAYANDNNIKWREDSSNASDKYLRNKIRHIMVPVLKDLNPDFLSAFQKTQAFLQEAETMVEDAAIMIYQQVAHPEGDDIHFDIKKLKQLPNYKSYLYRWLREFKFSAWNDIFHLIDSQSGKQVFSPDFRLLKDRDFLILSPLNAIDEQEHYLIDEHQTKVDIPLKISLNKVKDITTTTNKIIFVDRDLLTFPLVLKRWHEGDSFHPFGMAGKSKKVSKLLKDEKLSLLEKENTWLLYSGNKIVWVIGIRPDERFKISTSTKNKLQIALE